jgi:lactoylglutathione lyase
MSVRPFTVLGVQQVALGARDRRALRTLWVDCLGFTPVSTYSSASENVDEEILSVGAGLGRVEVDLMQPVDDSARPVIHEPPLHHVGLWIDALLSAVGWLVQHGVRIAPGGVRRGAAGHQVCFIHPKPSAYFPIAGNGVLIELVQAPPEVIAEYRLASGSGFPPTPATSSRSAP